MATTTATVTINSTDLLTDEISLSTTCTLTNAGGSNGLTGTGGLGRKTTSSTSQYILFDACRLYAGDWAFFPWNNHDGAADIKITPSVSTSITLEYMLFID